MAGNIWYEGVGNFALNLPDVRAGARIGLLGGSFDPAHEGHVAISLRAIRQARLDWVWWMVARQNPLKDAPSDSLPERLAQARRLTGHPLRHIWVSDVETRLGTRYTVDTIRTLRQKYPQVRFVVLMGSDSLVELSLWHNWRVLIHLLPLLVVQRENHAVISTSYQVKGILRGRILSPEHAYRLMEIPAPAACVLSGSKLPISSTKLRSRYLSLQGGSKLLSNSCSISFRRNLFSTSSNSSV